MDDYFTLPDEVLENKLGIRDAEKLKEAEEEIVAIRHAEILASFHRQRFDFECLRQIHERLFSDIYSFAGQIRSVDLVKAGSPVPFCYVQNIHDQLRVVFDALAQKGDLRGLERTAFARELAYLASELNAIHPFREGNGRSIRCFLILLAVAHGHILDFSKASTQSLLEADIAAFYGNPVPLMELYEYLLT